MHLDPSRSGTELIALPLKHRHRWKGLTLAAVALVSCAEGRLPLPAVQPQLQVALARHVLERGRPPEDYVLGKFETHDIVFVGEYGRIRHDVLLVDGLVGRLPAAGVHCLGIEFASATEQETIDRLLIADDYDDALARHLVKRHDPHWGYGEYLDLFRAAWTVNRTRADGETPFRILALGGADAEANAAVLRTEILSRGEKALIYTNIESAFTRFRPSSGEGARLGNLLFDEIGPRCATIFLHAPWPSRWGRDAPWVYPADGHIDASMIGLSDENRRAGFDVVGSPFAALPGETSWWSVGREGFQLGDLCDGYVFQTALHLYEGVTPLENWFDGEEHAAELAASCDIPRQFLRFH